MPNVASNATAAKPETAVEAKRIVFAEIWANGRF